MMTTTALDLDYLTEAERDLILSVIRKDEELHNKDQQRVDTLKSEIKALKVKGALKPGMDAEKSCARCRQPFGWIFDRGELCPKCKQKVCEACQCKITDSGQWLCILCKKQKDLDAMSGSWFFTQFRKSKRNKNTQEVISGSDIIKTSFRKNNVNAKMNGTSRTTEDVRRALAKGSSRDHSSSPEHEGESSDTQSMEAHHRPLKKTDLHDAAFPKDSEKIMLLDLLGGPSVAPVSAYGGNRPSRVPEPIQPNVHIQRVSTRRYSDSSSGGSDGGSGPSSPQFSHRTESEYAPSESINSSFRSTSAVSSDGRYTMVTDNASVISGISTAPPSMQDSPVLNSRHSSRHATNSQSTFAESFLNNSDKPLHSTAIIAKSPGGDSTHMAKKDNIGSSSDSMPEQFLQYQHLTDTGATGDDKHQVHTVKVVSRGKSASESSTDDDELNRRYNNNKQMYDSSPQQRSPAKMEAVVAGRTYSGRQPTWARSSGSDSSSTMHGRRANSDGLSQGSESCAETGSTIDAPVLDPPGQFSVDDNDIDFQQIGRDSDLAGARLAGWDGSNQTRMSGDSQTADTMQSMKDRISALLAKYNVKQIDSNATSDSPVTSFTINQNVHKIAPVISDDSINQGNESPPLFKKPKLSTDSMDDSIPSTGNQSTDTSFNLELSEDQGIELEWDNAISGVGEPAGERDLRSDSEILLSIKQQLNNLTKKPTTKDYSNANHEGDFLSDKSSRYPIIEDKQTLLPVPSHVTLPSVSPFSRDSDEYSDSLSVITERTEPEEDEEIDVSIETTTSESLQTSSAGAEVSESLNTGDIFTAENTVSKSLKPENLLSKQTTQLEISPEDEFENIYETNRKIVLPENQSKIQENHNFYKMFRTNLNYLESESQSVVFSGQDFDQIYMTNAAVVESHRESSHFVPIDKAKPTVQGSVPLVETTSHLKPHTKEVDPSSSDASVLTRKDSLTVLFDEEVKRRALGTKRPSEDLSLIVEANIKFAEEENSQFVLDRKDSAKKSDGPDEAPREVFKKEVNTTTLKQHKLPQAGGRGRLLKQDTIDELVDNQSDQDNYGATTWRSNKNNPKNTLKSNIKLGTDLEDSNNNIDESSIPSVATRQRQFEDKSFSDSHTVKSRESVMVENSPVQAQMHHFEHEILIKKEYDEKNQENLTEPHVTSLSKSKILHPVVEQDFNNRTLVTAVESKSSEEHKEKGVEEDEEDFTMTLEDMKDLGELLSCDIMHDAKCEWSQLLQQGMQEKDKNTLIDETNIEEEYSENASQRVSQYNYNLTANAFDSQGNNTVDVELAHESLKPGENSESSSVREFVTDMTEFENSQPFRCEVLQVIDAHITKESQTTFIEESNTEHEHLKKVDYSENSSPSSQQSNNRTVEHGITNDKTEGSTESVKVKTKLPQPDISMLDVTPSPVLRRHQKSPGLSRSVMHPAYQKHKKGSRPSSTGSTDSASIIISDCDSLFTPVGPGGGSGLTSSTPTAYLTHDPSSASPSPTGTPMLHWVELGPSRTTAASTRTVC